MTIISKLIKGIGRMLKARGMLYTIKFLFLDIAGNRLSLPIDGHVKELIFWEKQAIGIGSIAEKYLAKVDPENQKNSFPDVLITYIDMQREHLNKVPRVLDVGSGPVSLLAHGHKQGLIELTATDILANEYKTLLEVYGHSSAMEGIEVVNSIAETLGSSFAGRKFDIIYCNNAIDHTDSPKNSLAEMTKIAEPGAYIIVSGRQREGTSEGWDGIHMHDLLLEDDILYREGKDGERTRLDNDLYLDTLFVNASQQDFIDMFIVYERTVHKL